MDDVYHLYSKNITLRYNNETIDRPNKDLKYKITHKNRINILNDYCPSSFIDLGTGDGILIFDTLLNTEDENVY